MVAVYKVGEMKEFGRVDVKNLRMGIAEKEEELEKLRRGKSLVVIQLEREGESYDGRVVEWRLLGPRVRGKPSILPIPGALITQTGFTTFSSLDDAVELGREVNRQGDCAFQIASFHLKDIKRRAKAQ